MPVLFYNREGWKRREGRRKMKIQVIGNSKNEKLSRR
jgi:hypothetical protein